MLALLSLVCLLSSVLSTKTRSNLPWDGKIKHTIVLMLENRSFDHMIGNLRQNRSDIDGCQAQFAGNCSNPYDPTDPNSQLVYFNGNAVYIQPGDPGHSVSSTRTQLFGPNDNEIWPPPMNGFVYDYSSRDSDSGDNGAIIMSGFTSETLPIMSTLVNEFGVSDRWFCDIPGPTEPNRLFGWLGTSSGMAANDLDRLILGFREDSIFSMIDESSYGLNVTNDTWRVYFGQAPTAQFVEYTRKHPFKFHFMDRFYQDVKNNDLPIYTFLEPSYYDVIFEGDEWYAHDEHPDHDVTKGEELIKKIYESLRNSDLWNDTLLIITYDEHGGFFDHVPPPLTVNPDGKIGNDVNPPFNFTRLGIRVPTLFISPWIPKGFVTNRPNPSSNQYTASSILHTLREQYAPNIKPLTNRDEWSLTFNDILSLNEPSNQGPKILPNVPISNKDNNWIPGKQKPNEYQINIAYTMANLVGKIDEVHKYTNTQQELGEFVIKCSKQWLGTN